MLQDFDLLGQPREIIDEFPFFSYLLSDLHPHVLAMPFAMLVISLALNLYYQASRSFGPKRFLSAIIDWVKGEENPAEGLFLFSWMKKRDFWLAAVLLGGLAFINTWDFPIYVALFCCTPRRAACPCSRPADFISSGAARDLNKVATLHLLHSPAVERPAEWFQKTMRPFRSTARIA